jgi:peptidoglycan/xylan/chitin deacetylase (PgdA/CDA1 family)
LLYHRVGQGVQPHEVVATLPADLARQHLEALADVGVVMTLQELLAAEQSADRPRFAVTFDDDYYSHVRDALPLLRQLGAPATFFLSGRSLHGLGPYWWDKLEYLIADEGLEAACRFVGVDAPTPAKLAAAVEGREAAQLLDRLELGATFPLLTAGNMHDLIAGGMRIGFHTLRHSNLTEIGEGNLKRALTEGLSELEAVVGRPLLYFAYPHGQTNRRVAAGVEAAGFSAAFTGSGRPMGRGGDPYRLGRWEPGPLPVDQFIAQLAMRLHRSTGEPRR